ncbi:MAG TPA: hypothetical protein VFW52_02030 [Candidatus Saccharimonadales bacterium]|nr:hypothetical protein [Candidatus Saccharimonadales bacterium]
MFLVLEGSDGSGKTTQFKLLAERLRATGYEVDVYDFPRYDEPSSYFVRQYLNGNYGPASEVSPYTASFFYALDRFEAAPLIRQSLARGRVVLANRYTASNMAHQGAKFTKPAEQRGYFLWSESLEYQLFGIPRPALNLFLRVPADISFELISRKNARSYTNKSHDEHEADLEYLKSSVSAYDTLCELFPKDFLAIDCAKDGKIKPVTEINNDIWKQLKPLLPKPTKPGRSAIINLSEPVKKNAVKKTQDKPFAEPRGVRPGDNFELKDISLMMISWLIGRGFKVGYSLKWPPQNRLRLNYYIPAGLSPNLARQYKSAMDKFAALNSKMGKLLPKSEHQILDMAVPLAALTDATITGSKAELDQAMMEADAMGIGESRQIMSRGLPSGSGPQTLGQIIKHLSESKTGSHGATPDKPVSLAGVFPRNEFDLLADSLYVFSNQSRDEISAQIDAMTYKQKADALKTLCASDADRILSKLLYRFDLIGGAKIAEKLINLLNPAEVKIQPPTPRYGYDVPEQLDDAGITDDFIECFDTSLELYSDMQNAGRDPESGYSVLLGHKQRWQFTVNGSAIFGSYKNAAGQAAGFLKHFHELASEAHPLIATTVNDKRQAKNITGNSVNKPDSDRHRRPKNKRR